MKNGIISLLLILFLGPITQAQDCQVEIIQASSGSETVLELKARPADQVRGIRWSTGDSTNRIVVSDPGRYCVKVAFGSNCTAEDCIEISRPDSTPCIVEIKREAVASGIKLTAIPRPGDAVVSLKWNTGSDDRSIVVREPGKYCVGVRFSTGCTAEACVEVPRSDSAECTVEIKREATDAGIKLTAIPRPGDEVVSLKWNTGSDARSIVVREPGKYCVGVRFSTGCTAEACVEVPRSDSAECTVEIKREATDAGIKLTAIPRPGDAVVSLKWNTGSDARSIVVREPGKYCVGVRFSTGCTAEACVEVPRSDSAECTVEIKREATDAGIKLTAIPRPGDEVVSLKWNTGSDARSIAVREPGKYCVGVRFSTGCSAEACVEVPRSDSAECTVEIKREATDAGIKLTAIPRPGDAVVSLKWNTGSDDRSIVVREPGKYCVGVRFASGCTAEDCIEISGPECHVGFERYLTDTGILVSIVPRPDTGIVAVKWSTGDTGRQILVIAAGKYCVRVAYQDGCVAENCFEYSGPCAVNIRSARGKLGAKARGLAPFSYQWSTGDSSEVIEVESPGAYCVTITDASGCTSDACIEYNPELLQAAVWDAQVISDHKEVKQTLDLQSSQTKPEGNIQTGKLLVFPNPTDALWNIQLPINQSGTFIVQVQDMQGKVHIQKIINLDVDNSIVKIDGSNLVPGLYLTLIHDSTRYWALKTIRR